MEQTGAIWDYALLTRMALKKVTSVWNLTGVDIPNEVKDLAHRIGPTCNDNKRTLLLNPPSLPSIFK